MNANRLIGMAVRIVMNKVLSKGIDAGVNRMASRGGDPDAPKSDEDKRREQAAREQGRQAKKAVNVARRFTRF